MGYYDEAPDLPPPECSYWNGGKHIWWSDDIPDYRYSNNPTKTLRCRCGATKEVYD